MKRIITGLLLGASFVFLVFYAPSFWFFGAVLSIVSVAIFEYCRITVGYDKWLLAIGTALGSMVPVVIYISGLRGFFGYIIVAVFSIFAYSLFRHDPIASVTSRIGAAVLGVMYIAFPLSHLLLLRDLEGGRLWILFLFFIIAANDTCAYYSGRRWGRHKLSPVVSPGKTVEGAIGGLIGGIVFAAAFQQLLLKTITAGEAIGLAVIIGIVGQMGDLFESLIKRGAGVKDSGAILPGHGGVLDRIDSLIFAIPVLYYYLLIFRL